MAHTQTGWVDSMHDQHAFETEESGGLNPQYQAYECQKCFVGHSHEAYWRDDLLAVCNEVLPQFDLEPWYAAEHFEPTQSLREKVIELIANTHYGIYDLSYWRKDDKSEWVMPRNVLIELGIAIALNRPILLLRHAGNRSAGLSLPTCLESISTHMLEFSGRGTLKRVLQERLSQWASTPPEQDWWNRYCTFGKRICEHREEHPYLHQWGQETLCCHISDGQDIDRLDFREVVDEVLGRFADVTFNYLDGLPMAKGYDFLLCSHCQAVRSTPFAIYRITSQTPAETFIAIGMSLALEAQFTHKIPRILLTANIQDIPSLLTGYEVVVAHNDHERIKYLRKFVPKVIQHVRKTTWKARPLPFIEVVPHPVEQPVPEEENAQIEPLDETYIETIGKYGIIKEIGRGSFATIYLVRNTESKQTYAMKIMHPELAGDSELLGRFQREIQLHLTLNTTNDPHIVQAIDHGHQSNKHYIVMEYLDGHDLRQDLIAGSMEPLRVLNYARQIAEGLGTAYRLGIVHRDIKPQNIFINNQNMVKIIDFGLARGGQTITLTGDNAFMGTAYYIAPEQAESGRSTDTRSDLYSVATILFEMLMGYPPFQGETAVDVVIKHMNEKVPSICRERPGFPKAVDSFMQKAMAKSPADRYQTPREFIVALDQLQEQISAIPPETLAQSLQVIEEETKDVPDKVFGRCPYCGTETRPGDKFCLNCGRLLSTLQASPNAQFISEDTIIDPSDDWAALAGEQKPLVWGASNYPTLTSDNNSSSPSIIDMAAVPPPSPPSPAITANFAQNQEVSVLPGHAIRGEVDYTGKVISSYRILREIGRGGLGRIYLAEPVHSSGRAVAVKLFYSHLTSMQKQSLFFQHAHLLDNLRHPCILSTIEIRLQEHPLYVITEHAPHGSLQDRIKYSRLLPLQEVIAILLQIGQALFHIHQHNIVHRDLKPSNILFNEREGALLADFDIAVVLDTGDTKKVNKTGSPPYMAPEQFEGRVSRQSDQNGLGCLAYELCTGQQPFTAPDFIAMQFKHTTEVPVNPSQLNPTLPVHIEQAILKAMAKDERDRYPNVLAFVAALHAV